MNAAFRKGALIAVLAAAAATLAGCVVAPAPGYYGEGYYYAPAPVYYGPSYYYYRPGWNRWHGGPGGHGHGWR